MSVVMDSLSMEEGHEVERMWLADMVDSKWVEDYLQVKRSAYETQTDDDGAVYAMTENGKKLVKAPNVRCYRIKENVHGLAENVFKSCSELKEVDMPYTINDYDIKKAMRNCPHKIDVKVWNWPYEQARSEDVEKEIAEGWTDEHGFVYSQDRKRLLKAADAKTYWIPEGVERIDRLAFVGCVFEELHVPYTCRIGELSEAEYPIFGNERLQGCVLPWDRPYSKEDEIDDSLYLTEDVRATDKYGVAYSDSKKRLLWTTAEFDEAEYHVPDGVGTICSMAFAMSKRFLTLSVPSSIKVIGDNLFGSEGGKIIIRKD